MIHALFSHLSSLRHRALALFHRTDQRKADAAERRERWNQVIAEHKKPQDRPQDTSTSSAGGA
jgi:DNA-binding LacI/PurR family transcriptional regulator